MNEEQRIRRLSLIADAVDQHLPPDWIYVIYIGHPGDLRGTVNVICNAPYEMTDLLLGEILRRSHEGAKPKQLPEP
jgi:hypothetical protein